MSFVDTIGNSLKNIASTSNQFKDQVSSSTINSVQSVQAFVSSYSNSSILIGLVILVVLALFVSYGLYWLVADKLFNNTVDVILSSNEPLLGTSSTITKAVITPTGNGFRRSYTFWIYINDMSVNNGSYKHVLHLSSNSTDTINQSCPFIFLDKNENKLNIRFAADNAYETITTNFTNINSLTDDYAVKKFMIQGIQIPYVPLQRWVHIGIVINQTISTTTISCYVDGDISVIKSSGDRNDVNGSSTGSTITNFTLTHNPIIDRVKYENLNLNTTGNLTVGGDNRSNDSGGIGFSGLISKFKSFNYDINQKDIYKDYNEGPVNSLLLNLGLKNYGLRNPVYELS